MTVAAVATIRNDEDIAGLCHHADLVVYDIREKPEWKTFGLDRQRLAISAKNGLDGSRIRHLQRPALIIPESKEHGHILRIEFAFLERIVQHAEHLRGFWPLNSG